MSKPPTNPAMPVQPSPDPLENELARLLAEPVAQSWAGAGPGAASAQSIHERLGNRLAAARQAEAGMVTVRHRKTTRRPVADGVHARALYRARPGAPLRPGEPLRATLIELAAGAVFGGVAEGDDENLNDASLHREWLVLSGSVRLRGETLSRRDYHVTPAGQAPAQWAAPEGAVLFLRESPPHTGSDEVPFTVRDAQAGWPEFAPGIRRRVLWQGNGQAALLYYAQPGAKVPGHRHDHDEECLMVQGELFLDDVLLQAGDYQLAPAGTGHRLTETDTGVVIYAHGDLDLQFV